MKILDWLFPPMTRERGENCAKGFLAKNPTSQEIDAAYANADHFHADLFDQGWMDTIYPFTSAHFKDLLS